MGPFDPDNPFKGSWRCESIDSEEEESSDPGEGQSTAAARARDWPAERARHVRAEEVDEDAPEQLSEQGLRQRLAERGLGVPPWCADRAALIELAKTLDCTSPVSTAGCRTPARRLNDSGPGSEAATPLSSQPMAIPNLPQGGQVESSGGVDVLQGLSDFELHEMLAASGLPVSGALTRAELEERLLRSQSTGLG
uniref:Uncharacterized protein n=1 Tax=Alexandrium catenella TaxID=2925 RepID=A0A7S1MRE3_ALECA